MKTLFGEIQSGTLEVLSSVVLALIALGGAYATHYIKMATDKLKAETMQIEDDKQRWMLDRALERMEKVAEKTVRKFEETSAKKIRMAIADGKANRKELESLATDAYKEIIHTLEPEYSMVIQSSLGDAKTYIMNTIEEKVKDIKLKG